MGTTKYSINFWESWIKLLNRQNRKATASDLTENIVQLVGGNIESEHTIAQSPFIAPNLIHYTNKHTHWFFYTSGLQNYHAINAVIWLMFTHYDSSARKTFITAQTLQSHNKKTNTLHIYFMISHSDSWMFLHKKVNKSLYYNVIHNNTIT